MACNFDAEAAYRRLKEWATDQVLKENNVSSFDELPKTVKTKSFKTGTDLKDKILASLLGVPQSKITKIKDIHRVNMDLFLLLINKTGISPNELLGYE